MINGLYPLFKSEENVTPRVWLTRHQKHRKKMGYAEDETTGEKHIIYYCKRCREFYFGDRICDTDNPLRSI